MLTSFFPDLDTYLPLILTVLVILVETILAVIIYCITLVIRESMPQNPNPQPMQSRWKRWLLKWLLLLGTLTAMIGTALWALQLDDMSPGLTKIDYYHFPVFPIMYGTALFYLFQPDGSPCFFFKIPMRYIYLGYVVLAVVALIQRFLKKPQGYNPSGHPQAGQPV